MYGAEISIIKAIDILIKFVETVGDTMNKCGCMGMTRIMNVLLSPLKLFYSLWFGLVWGFLMFLSLSLVTQKILRVNCAPLLHCFLLLLFPQTCYFSGIFSRRTSLLSTLSLTDLYPLSSLFSQPFSSLSLPLLPSISSRRSNFVRVQFCALSLFPINSI